MIVPGSVGPETYTPRAEPSGSVHPREGSELFSVLTNSCNVLWTQINPNPVKCFLMCVSNKDCHQCFVCHVQRPCTTRFRYCPLSLPVRSIWTKLWSNVECHTCHNLCDQSALDHMWLSFIRACVMVCQIGIPEGRIFPEEDVPYSHVRWKCHRVIILIG